MAGDADRMSLIFFAVFFFWCYLYFVCCTKGFFFTIFPALKQLIISVKIYLQLSYEIVKLKIINWEKLKIGIKDYELRSDKKGTESGGEGGSTEPVSDILLLQPSNWKLGVLFLKFWIQFQNSHFLLVRATGRKWEFSLPFQIAIIIKLKRMPQKTIDIYSSSFDTSTIRSDNLKVKDWLTRH